MMQYNHNYLNDGEPEVYMRVTVREGSSLDLSPVSLFFSWCWDGMKQIWSYVWKWI